MEQENTTQSKPKRTVTEKELLSLPKYFKSTKCFSKFYYSYIFEILQDYLSNAYLFTQTNKGQKKQHVHVHRYLIFKDGTDLSYMRNLVHQILPHIEVIDDCSNEKCTCKAIVKNIPNPRIIKRRGFGYITEPEVLECVSKLKQLNLVCRFEKFKVKKPRKQTLKNDINCEKCDFIAKSEFGYQSHFRARHNDTNGSKTPKVCS